jgi:hypothetical protein
MQMNNLIAFHTYECEDVSSVRSVSTQLPLAEALPNDRAEKQLMAIYA